ncbi:MAG: mechanosensitive ion channel family protein [Reichenbachiella sp.]|uniref:mechanosensitive ion channel family protein n=1 Tax=Reichenbachiella sp. TaxID=2184521 RepID=UPI0029664937|nr:mechanosensitive ion channel family protein [Reichenbachiella sp.]MDW3210554.1 mechanosensitive ion channel family protein [Reichenbachiella sp.]
MQDKLIIQSSLSVGLLIVYSIAKFLTRRYTEKFATSRKFKKGRAADTAKIINSTFTVTCLILLGFIWNITFEGIAIYFASFFTVAGIALFASWSILSNITASAVLFFSFPHRIGTKIRIVDGDNTIEGTIIDMTLFSLQLEVEKKKTVFYPNNLALQKPIMEIKD